MLRKQKSLTGEYSTRRLRLQKQFSIDQNVIGGASNRHSTSSGHSKLLNSLANANNNNSWTTNEPSPEASLRIFTAFKNKSTPNNGFTANDE